jgi:hypothetical protein
VNTFVLELFDDEGAACTFYTVRWEDAEESETDRFFSKFEKNPRLMPRLQDLAQFVYQKIGEEMGAVDAFFRPENAAQALPPSGYHRVQALNINYHRFPLRLYCLRITKNLVVLFNGGEKTATSAQGGRTSMAFHDANQFAIRIRQALQSGEITIAPDQRTLLNDQGTTQIIL